MTEASVPFTAYQGGYASYRIPAVVVTAAGTLLAFCEGRVDSASDHGHIEIVLRRSTDGGRTWGPQTVAADNGGNLAGNPAPVVLDTGRILLVHVRAAATATEDAILRGKVTAADGRTVWVRYSDDDGVTWSTPKEITAQVKKPEWRWYATTPGHAIQLSTGRVVVPGNHTIPPTGTDVGNEGKYNSGHCLLSDDRGETWSIGYVDENPNGYVNCNETTAAELPDGRVYFNTRNDATAPGHRADAYSADGGTTLVKPFRPQAWPHRPRLRGRRPPTPRPRPAVVLRPRRPGRPRPDDPARLHRRRHHLAPRAHGRRTARRRLRPGPDRRRHGRTPLRDGRLRGVRDDHVPAGARDGPHLSRYGCGGGRKVGP